MKKAKKIVLGILIGYIGVMIGVYFVMAGYFSKHFYTGSSINGIDVGGKTVEEVKELIQDNILDYQLTLKTRGGKEEVLKGAQLGLTYVDDGSVEKLLKDQNPYRWVFSLAHQKTYEMAANRTYDRSVVEKLVDKLECLQPENIIKPQDAYMQETENGYEIVPETAGNELRGEEVQKAVLKALDSGETQVDFEALNLYEAPKVLSNDEELLKEVEALNQMTAANIVYDFVDRSYTVDRALLKEWFSKNAEGEYVLDREKVAAWVRHMAYETDTFGLAHDFKTSLGPTIKLAAGGDYGWVINKDKTTQELIEAIETGFQGKKEPVYLYKGKDRSKNDIGGTYVEISIKEQRMWCYKDGQLVVDTPVITGNHSTGYDTPSGSVWAIDAKQTNRQFDLYDAYVNFWLPFNGNVGIHDASWRTPEQYTKTFYENSGSHGCINTPYEAAKKVHATVGIGDPVIVYYSTDQVVGPAPTQENEMG